MTEQARRRGRCAFRPGTVANHQSHSRLYVAFTIYFRLADFPATATVLLAFGKFLLRSFTAPKSVLNVFSSIRRLHLDYRMSVAAFDEVELVRWRRALGLTVRSVPVQAPSLPLRVLEELCVLARATGGEGETMAAFLAVAFHALTRASTLLSLSEDRYDSTRLPTLADVGDRYDLLIKWDKTHQATSQSYTVPLLARPTTAACPVRAVKGLLSRGASLPSSAPLFATAGLRGTHTISVPLTMVRARTWLRNLLQVKGLRGDAYTLHSLRRGGCTLAYAGGGGSGGPAGPGRVEQQRSASLSFPTRCAREGGATGTSATT